MKKFLLIVSILIVVGIIGFLVVNESKPEGKPGPQAEALADEILKAINKEAWDTTKFISWSFLDAHYYKWDKQNNVASISWDEFRVDMNLNSLNARVFKNQIALEGSEFSEIKEKAWAFWCNDSFWFNAPSKIKDPGTERSLVILPSGEKALLVSYKSGGVTPGDSYLWIVNEKNLPNYYKMWVSVIPIGGLKASWEDWIQLESGALVSTNHDLGPASLEVRAIKSGEHPEDIGLDVALFEGLY